MKSMKNVNGIIYPPDLIWMQLVQMAGKKGKRAITSAIFLYVAYRWKKGKPAR
jgi:hypothetical protein